jgi:cytochrome c biogenesis protein CcmG/thiol:disulfide interchange protein DsbE
MWKYFAPLVIFGLFFLVLKSGMDDIREGKNVNELPSPLIAKPAPQFELPSLADSSRTVSNSTFAGKPAVLNVWATWCVGCRQEHGFLMELSESGTVPVYGLNWRDNRAEAQRFLQQLGDPFIDSAYDEDGRVGIDWGVYGAPETFLIGADGTVLYKHLGPLNWALWRENFAPHLETAGQTQ